MTSKPQGSECSADEEGEDRDSNELCCLCGDPLWDDKVAVHFRERHSELVAKQSSLVVALTPEATVVIAHRDASRFRAKALAAFCNPISRVVVTTQKENLSVGGRSRPRSHLQ